MLCHCVRCARTGCYRRVYINNRLVDFKDTSRVKQVKVIPGCPGHDRPDPCAAHMCKHGQCVALEGMSYECDCYRGHSGPMCDQPIAPSTVSPEGKEAAASDVCTESTCTCTCTCMYTSYRLYEHAVANIFTLF